MLGSKAVYFFEEPEKSPNQQSQTQAVSSSTKEDDGYKNMFLFTHEKNAPAKTEPAKPKEPEISAEEKKRLEEEKRY